MVSLDKKVVEQLRLSPSFNIERMARCIKDCEMPREVYSDFNLVLDILIESSFGQGYKTTDFIPSHYNVRDRISQTFYPTIITAPAPKERIHGLSFIKGNDDKGYIIAGHIGLPYSPTDGSVLFVSPRYMKQAYLYKETYEALFDMIAEVQEITDEDLLHDTLDSEEMPFSTLNLT